MTDYSIPKIQANCQDFILSLINNKKLNTINNNNLICGIYENLPVDNVKGGLLVFLKSLRKYNTNCKIIIWCDKNKFIPEYSIIEKQFDCLFVLYNIFNTNHHIQTRRLYLTRILLNIYKPNLILLSDMNDVYFQNDPFKIDLQNSNIYCALETNHFSKRTQSIRSNEKWLNRLSIDKKYYKSEYVICSGTIYGNYQGIIEFLDWVYNNNFLIHPNVLGLDQGYWIQYIYSVIKKNKCVLTKIEESDILTCDRMLFPDTKNNKFINK